MSTIYLTVFQFSIIDMALTLMCANGFHDIYCLQLACNISRVLSSWRLITTHPSVHLDICIKCLQWAAVQEIATELIVNKMYQNDQYPIFECLFLVSGHGLACQQEISLVLAKTPPIHYWTMMDSTFNNYAG